MQSTFIVGWVWDYRIVPGMLCNGNPMDLWTTITVMSTWWYTALEQSVSNGYAVLSLDYSLAWSIAMDANRLGSVCSPTNKRFCSERGLNSGTL